MFVNKLKLPSLTIRFNHTKTRSTIALQIAIIREKFLPVINKLLVSGSHPDIQCHAAGTLRNLSTEDHKDEILKAGSVTALVDVLLDSHTSVGVCAEASAALAVLAANGWSHDWVVDIKLD